jgi:NADPH:quinone reductase-like Zn-dependent oxidoreductase
MVRAFGYSSHGGPDVQEFLDLEMPSPLAGELLVEVRTAGVNPADWKIRSGMFGDAKSADPPAVLGSEVSGVVREVGKDVYGFADRQKLISAGDPETVSDLGGHMIERDRTHRVLEMVAGLAADGKLDPLVQDVRPLDEAADAIAAVEVGHAKGKVVIEVSA